MKNEDHQDRLVDMLLKELVAGEKPPHLREKILTRLSDEKAINNTRTHAPPKNVLQMKQDDWKLPNTAPKQRSVASRIIVAAAVIVLCATPAFLYHKEIVMQRSPVIISSKGNVTPASGLLGPSQTIKSDENSSASLLWPDGTEVKIHENTEVTASNKSFFHSAKKLSLGKGSLYASVARQKANTPMSISTSDSLTEVLGTSFTLSNRDAKTRIEVDSGKIRFTPVKESKPLILEQGTYAESFEGKKFAAGSIKKQPPGITGFTLINADSDKPIRKKAVKNNEVFSLASLPTKNLSLRADFRGQTPHRVKFKLRRVGRNSDDLPKVHAQHFTPFYLIGDFSSQGRTDDARPWTPAPGKYRITAIPGYRENGAVIDGEPHSLVICFKE